MAVALDVASVFIYDQTRAATEAALARRANVTTRTLEKSFMTTIGETPGAYFLRLRLSAARRLVLDTTEPTVDIDARTGFSSAAAFSRTFAKSFGQSPMQMRKTESVRSPSFVA